MQVSQIGSEDRQQLGLGSNTIIARSRIHRRYCKAKLLALYPTIFNCNVDVYSCSKEDGIVWIIAVFEYASRFFSTQNIANLPSRAIFDSQSMSWSSSPWITSHRFGDYHLPNHHSKRLYKDIQYGRYLLVLMTLFSRCSLATTNYNSRRSLPQRE